MLKNRASEAEAAKGIGEKKYRLSV